MITTSRTEASCAWVPLFMALRLDRKESIPTSFTRGPRTTARRSGDGHEVTVKGFTGSRHARVCASERIRSVPAATQASRAAAFTWPGPSNAITRMDRRGRERELSHRAAPSMSAPGGDMCPVWAQRDEGPFAVSTPRDASQRRHRGTGLARPAGFPRGHQRASYTVNVTLTTFLFARIVLEAPAAYRARPPGCDQCVKETRQRCCACVRSAISGGSRPTRVTVRARGTLSSTSFVRRPRYRRTNARPVTLVRIREPFAPTSE